MALDPIAEATQLIKTWEEEQTQPNYNPLSMLTRLAEIIEQETENYLKMDPDPFDERHPFRTDPNCKLGIILKILFKKEPFLNKLVNDYLRENYYARLGITARDIEALNVAACRLMLDIMPGLEVSVVFQPEMESLILRLIKWTLDGSEPLRTYATGLLAAAVEIPEIATKLRDHNANLIPVLINRLKTLQESSNLKSSLSSRPFAHFASSRSPAKTIMESSRKGNSSFGAEKRSHASLESSPDTVSPIQEQRQNKKMKLERDAMSPPQAISRVSALNESSNSSWAEMESFMIGSIQMYPLNDITKQILIIQYLTPMGEYQEFLSHVFENNVLELILSYVNVRETKQARLAFEALKYLAALLCHKKFSLEFIQSNGLECLLDVPRPSIAATGVSICLYYLGYCEDAMEKVCLLPKCTVSALVRYALWLLECSHDSSKCHATMFFGLTFQFKVILDEFDAQDGLRKLYNVIATLPILLGYMEYLQEDAECAARQVVRHICVAYKKYLEAHLSIKAEQIRRSEMRPSDMNGMHLMPNTPIYKPSKSSPDEVQQQIELLLQHFPFNMCWPPVESFLKLGVITLLLKILAYAYEWNYSGRSETVRSILDVLAIACVLPKVQLVLCERVDFPEEAITLGMKIILGAAEGGIVRDADVQKSAIRVIINCVCGPINRTGGNIARYLSPAAVNSPSKKIKVKTSEDLIQKMWDCVRSNSGIMVLLQLMNTKTPITDADCMRTLACKALAGLARCDTVKQIVSKLPMFLNGELQTLMRDPILQEKRQEHVLFQKYAMELLGRLSGRISLTGTDVSLINIHRASIVAQTKIVFNDKQLLQLIHQHLLSKGLQEAASALQKEANLEQLTMNNIMANHPSKYRYNSPHTSRVRLSSCHSPMLKNNISSNALTLNDSLNNSSNNTPNVSLIGSSTPIKLVRKNSSKTNSVTNTPKTSLQKQRVEYPIVKHGHHFEEPAEPRVTLDSIITQYLTGQHALCKNPVATCPQFDLFVPHKCPDPKLRISNCNNFVMRHARRQMGYNCKNMDRRLIHSRFCSVQTMRNSNNIEGFFTCVKIMPGDQSIAVGDYEGGVIFFNVHTGNMENSFRAHDNYLVNLEPSRAGDVMLTSSTWRKPLSALWSINGEHYNLLTSYHEEEHVEFSKVTQNKVIGTKGEEATIFDVQTGEPLIRFMPKISNQYTKNKATFSPNDDLVLSDGVLFDVNSGKEIHTLDKLNQSQSGVFHPNGREIIANMEVWDMRTFHLLKTVPALNQCNLRFAPANNAIYAFSMEQEGDEDNTFESSFKTIDALDYSSIATIDVKRSIYDMAVSNNESQIAIVENQGIYYSVQESVVRLYDVGRRRDDEDQDDDEEDDDLDNSDDDGSDGDDNILLNNSNENDDNSEEDNDDDEAAEDDGDGEDDADDYEEDGDDSDDDDSWTDISGTSGISYNSDMDLDFML